MIKLKGNINEFIKYLRNKEDSIELVGYLSLNAYSAIFLNEENNFQDYLVVVGNNWYYNSENITLLQEAIDIGLPFKRLIITGMKEEDLDIFDNKIEIEYLLKFNKTDSFRDSDIVKKIGEEQTSSAYSLLKKIPEINGMNSEKEFENYLRNTNFNYMIEKDDQCVCLGFVIFEQEKNVLIVSVGTHPNYRKQGLAGTLVSKICNDMVLQEKEVYLYCSNKEALSVYSKVGLEKTGKNKLVLKESIKLKEKKYNK